MYSLMNRLIARFDASPAWIVFEEHAPHYCFFISGFPVCAVPYSCEHNVVLLLRSDLSYIPNAVCASVLERFGWGMKDKGIIHVVDDDSARRHSLSIMLEDAGYEVRLYFRAEDFVLGTAIDQVGCVVSDVRMPGMDGLQLLATLRAKGNNAPVVLMTGHADIALAVAATRAGAADFLEKPFETAELLTAIDAALAGTKASGLDKGHIARSARSRIEELTPREHEILESLVSGKSNKETAAELGLSPRTVEFHRAHILAKMGVRGLPQLVRLWIEAK